MKRVRGSRKPSRAYYSLENDSDTDSKADITYDNGKNEEIVLPVFNGHYTSKDIEVKNTNDRLNNRRRNLKR